VITIIYSFRNREIDRVRKSLNSLCLQTNKNFNVIFIDYGSQIKTAQEVKNTVESFSFCTHYYVYAEFQIWNKSKALNFAIKKVTSDYCFIADVDMIFHPNFIEILNEKKVVNIATYFQVGFLSKEESLKEVPFEEYKINFLTDENATGMTLFPVEKLHLINGFDEFFHFWGAEDTDIHNRLKNVGCDIVYNDSKLLLLHQWHKNFRSRETKKISQELQLRGIVELNNNHMWFNFRNKVSQINKEGWGEVIKPSDFEELKGIDPQILSREKSKINHFLYNELPNSKEKVLAVKIKKGKIDRLEIKYLLKKILRRKVAERYTLREINDLFLIHIISFYNYFPYSYQISDDLENITFKIKK